jgi:predicted metal-binding membrane protein
LPTNVPSSPPPATRPIRLLGLQLAAALVFIATAAYTIYCTHSMAGGMNMPGGWTMSMMWMQMPGQSLLGAAVMFTAMWAAMMVAMMLPSAMPMILLYRRVTATRNQPDSLAATVLLSLGYFGVWTALGLFTWALGTLIAKFEMSSPALSRAVPTVAGISLILCGLYQWTPWKCSCLRHCRDPLHLLSEHLDGGKWGALRLGLHHGSFCAACCWSLMLMQIVLGMMNLIVMTLIALVIAFEKMLPRGIAIAKIVGAISTVTGLYILLNRNFPF